MMNGKATRSTITVQVVAPLLLLALLIGGTVNAGEPRVPWQSKWERLLRAAKKEAKVAIYGSYDYEFVFERFRKKYPEIKMTFVPGRGPDTAQRILSERRAGKYLADLYLSGIGTGYNVLYKGRILDPVKSTLILPEVVDKWSDMGPILKLVNEVVKRKR